MPSRSALASLAMLLCVSGISAAQRAPYTPEQLALIRMTSDGRLAPDGRTVAFITDISGSPELWTVPTAGGWPTQLTNLNENISDVRWSPDGRWIVFVADHGGDELRDLYRVPANGGAIENLTSTIKISEGEPRFAPDGKRLAFTSDSERDSVFLLNVLDLETRKRVPLTEEALIVQTPIWSPDGRTIAVTRSGDGRRGDLLLVDAATGAKRVVEPLAEGGILWPVAFSPEGTSLLLRARNQNGFLQLAVLEFAGSDGASKSSKPMGAPAFIGPGDWDVTEAAWTGDGIWFLRNEGGATSLSFLRSPRDKPGTLLTAEGVLSKLNLDRSGHNLALLRQDVNTPADVWVADVAAASAGAGGATDSQPALEHQLRQVTFSLMGGIKTQELARGAMVHYESFDRKTVHALLLRPKVNRLGNPPPAVVYVHPGPDLALTRTFDPFLQALAEAGFAVIAPSYRGSDGHGKAFEDANYKDWAGGDLKDLVAAVHHFGASGDIDPRRVGITGGSYGGYLTLMALARTPEIWRAGVEGYGMVDLQLDYLLTQGYYGRWYQTEMGDPATEGKLYRERSPLPYLQDIKAPLLIFQGINDSEVPKLESDLLASVLKAQEKPHEYIVYNDEGHGFTRRKNLLDHDRRSLRFFIKHLVPEK